MHPVLHRIPTHVHTILNLAFERGTFICQTVRSLTCLCYVLAVELDGGAVQDYGVDLSVGLAVHTRALLVARQAAVAGLPLSEIDARCAWLHVCAYLCVLMHLEVCVLSLAGGPSSCCCGAAPV